ncbi:MFS general substrate transporter [Rhizodiscina lignyota]|uniref:MFS general substrate transporter n=1 Tax=Rhizodiscina lignyota TaxID=1504668 RepID=A0A9P4M597_9PEZI|nr:MFS general substrate transporter [Rhizodiscina lignyota]
MKHGHITDLEETELALVELSPAEEKRILRKVDWLLVPQLTILYLMAFLDRSNIGNAKIAGMTEDLKLVGLDYNIALTTFFVSYSLFEVPSNMLLKLVPAGLWIAGIMVAWGVIMTLMGITQSKEGLYAARFFLGVAEAGLFPGATYLLTLWYKRYEVQFRMAIFYFGASLSGAFSGLLAFAITKMDGVSGLGGWRWIFILEGIATVVIGCIALFTLPGGPLNAKFLNKVERQFIISRLQVETGSGRGRVTNEDPITMAHFWSAMKEWKIWVAVLTWWANSVTVYGFTYTVPSVIVELGYSAANAQLMTIPIYLCALLGVLFCAWISDKYQTRAYVIAAAYYFGAAGFLALIFVPHPGLPGLTYGLLFPAATGIYSGLIPTLGFIANNLAPSSKRAVGMGLLVSMGNLGGGLIGSNIYLDRMKPHYYVGYGFCFSIMIVGATCALVLRWAYKRINDKRDRMTEEEIRAKYTESELLALGDRSPLFRYAY